MLRGGVRSSLTTKLIDKGDHKEASLNFHHEN